MTQQRQAAERALSMSSSSRASKLATRFSSSRNSSRVAARPSTSLGHVTEQVMAWVSRVDEKAGRPVRQSHHHHDLVFAAGLLARASYAALTPATKVFTALESCSACF